MAKKDFYLVLDTETATLPLVKMLTEGNEAMRKNLAIAKPLVYDIGWQIIDRQGNVYKKVNYLVQETFFVPQVFSTAYYCEKRPIYMDMLNRGEVTAKMWNDIIPELMADAETCKAVCAYNAAFDFKKAIPYTERYINALYGDYNKFERGQKYSIERSIAEGKVNTKNPKYLTPDWEIRGETFPIIDLWDVACRKLINIDKYRKFCLENGLWTNSVIYFKTSAETAFQYLENMWDFEEAHTALDDARIESMILAKALKKGKVEPCMGAFPFRELGETYRFALNKDRTHVPALYTAMDEYIDTLTENSAYSARMQNILGALAEAMETAE